MFAKTNFAFDQCISEFGIHFPKVACGVFGPAKHNFGGSFEVRARL